MGCNTAEKNLKKGTSLENKGQYYEAALRYITALEKDATLRDAREGLSISGASAVVQLSEDARMAQRAQNYRNAKDAYLKIDQMLDRTTRVGVDVRMPMNYAETRRGIMEEAYMYYMNASDAEMRLRKYEAAENMLNEAMRFDPTSSQQEQAEAQRNRIYLDWSNLLIEDGRRLEADRRWEGAFKAYEKATQKSPTDQMRRQMQDASVSMLVKWGEDDMRYGRYRGAHERATRALQLVPNLDAAERLAREAIDRGTLQVAMLPIYRTAAAAVDMPNDFLADLNDALQYDFWDKPPMFIRSADPREIRSIMRRENLNDRVLSDDRVYDLGRRINANLVMYGEVTRYYVKDEVRSERSRTVKTRTGQDVTYKEQTIRRMVESQVDFRVVEPSRRRQFCAGKAEQRDYVEFKIAVYNGNPNDLDLGRNERRIFDETDKREALERLTRDVNNNLSRKMAERVFDEIIREMQ